MQKHTDRIRPHVNGYFRASNIPLNKQTWIACCSVSCVTKMSNWDRALCTTAKLLEEMFAKLSVLLPVLEWGMCAALHIGTVNFWKQLFMPRTWVVHLLCNFCHRVGPCEMIGIQWTALHHTREQFDRSSPVFVVFFCTKSFQFNCRNIQQLVGHSDQAKRSRFTCLWWSNFLLPFARRRDLAIRASCLWTVGNEYSFECTPQERSTHETFCLRWKSFFSGQNSMSCTSTAFLSSLKCAPVQRNEETRAIPVKHWCLLASGETARHPMQMPLGALLSVWPFQVPPEITRYQCLLVRDVWPFCHTGSEFFVSKLTALSCPVDRTGILTDARRSRCVVLGQLGRQYCREHLPACCEDFRRTHHSTNMSAVPWTQSPSSRAQRKQGSHTVQKWFLWTYWLFGTFGRTRSCVIEQEPFLWGENPFLPRCEHIRPVLWSQESSVPFLATNVMNLLPEIVLVAISQTADCCRSRPPPPLLDHLL